MPVEIPAIAPSDDTAEEIAIVRAIPDGICLAYYPTHDDSPSCWCHPRSAWGLSGEILVHKDLQKGEFDS